MDIIKHERRFVNNFKLDNSMKLLTYSPHPLGGTLTKRLPNFLAKRSPAFFIMSFPIFILAPSGQISSSPFI